MKAINSIASQSFSVGAAGDIQVEIDNDGGSRDVMLDYVYVYLNGEIRQAEDIKHHTATYPNGQCGGGSYSVTA